MSLGRCHDSEWLVQRLLAEQYSNGAFRSTVFLHDRKLDDYNGFVTAQVLRAISTRLEPQSPVMSRALDFLERCAYPMPQGSFGFWPREKVPAWMPAPLPPDADDTAVIALELGRAGRRTMAELREIACNALVTCRAGRLPAPRPPWIREGVFLTWLRPGPGNVVDCVVNANVIALLAFCGLWRVPGFEQAVTLIENALDWAGPSLERAQTITPFYPDPSELLHAVRQAVSCGAVQLLDAQEKLERLPWGQSRSGAEVVACGSAYGEIQWHSELLGQLRWPPARMSARDS